MKKYTMIAAIVIAAMILAALVGCRGSEVKPVPTEEPTAAPTAEPTEAPTEEPTEVPTEEPTAEPTQEADSTEELIAQYAEMIKPQMEAIMQAQDVLDIDCYAEGKALVIEYKYRYEVSVDIETLRGSLDAQGASCANMYTELAAYANDEDVSVILRYLTCEGEKLLDYVVDKDYSPEG
ncbi:MAG: DUF4854 domain-containing protein [Clostridia bacterium]|nr:DUF4854 domain-containing protein [Clostridia bacterium]